MWDDSLAPAQCESGQSLGRPRKMSMKEKLFQEKSHIEARLSTINEALAALEANPQVEKVLEILSRAI